MHTSVMQQQFGGRCADINLILWS